MNYRPRSKSDSPQRSKSEGKSCDLRDTKSLMLLPHLKLGLEPKNSKAKRLESDVIVRFPEKSVLLLAQDDDDQVQIELSTSSVTLPNSQQNVRRRRGDSGVHISDGAVLKWSRREEESRSEPAIPSTSGLFGNQPHVRRVATKSSLQSNYIPSLERLVEEPLLPHKVCKQQGSSVAVRIADPGSSGPSERKDLGEVVVSHWERAEQQRIESEQSTQQSSQTSKSCSFENRASSLSLVNEVTEEVLFKRSSSYVSFPNR